MNDRTIDYYDNNATQFVENTVNADISSNLSVFESYLKPGACVLDFGCGSGRDTKHFAECGYQVEATDGSAELCRMASEYSLIDVKHMLFQDLNEYEKYDGIWACSSILHLPRQELKSVFGKMKAALKPEGVIYTSFKYGDFSGERNGRYFTDFTEETFEPFIKEVSGIAVIKSWVTADVRPGRGDEKWLNLILRKE